MVKVRRFEFVIKIKKHAISTWRILIPIMAVKLFDLRKKVKVTLTQYDKDCISAGVNHSSELGEI